MLRARRRKPAVDVVVPCWVPDVSVVMVKFLTDGQAYELANSSTIVMLSQRVFSSTSQCANSRASCLRAPHTDLPPMIAN